MERLLLTVSEVAESLHLSRNKVYELLYSGALASAKIGGCRRVSVAALHDYIASIQDPEYVA